MTAPQLSAAGFDPVTASALIEPLLATPAPLLEALHALQDHFGYIDPAAIALLAERINLSRAEVHGVISFYHYFRTAPPGRHTLRICRAEACQAMGAETLLEHARDALGCDLHETSDDGAISLEPVYCLGNCACAPSALLDATLHGRLDACALNTLIDSAREQSPA